MYYNICTPFHYKKIYSDLTSECQSLPCSGYTMNIYMDTILTSLNKRKNFRLKCLWDRICFDQQLLDPNFCCAQNFGKYPQLILQKVSNKSRHTNSEILKKCITLYFVPHYVHAVQVPCRGAQRIEWAKIQ